MNFRGLGHYTAFFHHGQISFLLQLSPVSDQQGERLSTTTRRHPHKNAIPTSTPL